MPERRCFEGHRRGDGVSRPFPSPETAPRALPRGGILFEVVHG